MWEPNQLQAEVTAGCWWVFCALFPTLIPTLVPTLHFLSPLLSHTRHFEQNELRGRCMFTLEAGLLCGFCVPYLVHAGMAGPVPSIHAF